MTIDHYLDDLCASLAVDPLRRDEIRLETHQHLRERTRDLIRQGIDPMDAEERATMEFGDVVEVASRLSATPSLHSSAELFRPIRSAAIMMIGLGFYWLCTILVTTNLDYFQRERLSQKIFDLVLVSLLYPLPVLAGMGLLRRSRWARWGAVLSSGLMLWMLFEFYRSVLLQARYLGTGIQWYSVRTEILNVPGGIIGFYVLWTLLHPRYRALSWR
jgi:hypothetical protein